jgi:putative endonuclease
MLGFRTANGPIPEVPGLPSRWPPLVEILQGRVMMPRWRGIALTPPTRPGDLGEATAARFLERRGFRILARNLRSRLGELDLVARDGGVVVFVEVKARRRGWGDPPQAAVDGRKRARLARLAQAYLQRSRLGDVPCRFDVVAVTLDPAGGPAEIDHLPGAFTLDRWTD